ncbi:ribonuclease E, partial [Streptomyces sp. TverLS-915]|uniref:hypothetical protein n=1 Tax=Streptomyces sp. TverLS-915 TaxID=1839763 RepID=UPI00081D9D39
MLEPKEPGTSGTHDDTPSSPGDTLPPRRRRRAASRPAGPPAGQATAENPAAEQAAPAIPAKARETETTTTT